MELVANKLSRLSNILYFMQNYYKKYCVTLSYDKTKLTMIYKGEESRLEAHNPIKIEGHDIKFCSKADHVGVVQSSASNRPHILSRICSHRKALRMKSRANPLVGLRLQCIYGTLVLYYYQGCD